MRASYIARNRDDVTRTRGARKRRVTVVHTTRTNWRPRILVPQQKEFVGVRVSPFGKRPADEKRREHEQPLPTHRAYRPDK